MTTAAITLDELLADNEAATEKWQGVVRCQSSRARSSLRDLQQWHRARAAETYLCGGVASFSTASWPGSDVLRRNSCRLIGRLDGHPCASDPESPQIPFNRERRCFARGDSAANRLCGNAACLPAQAVCAYPAPFDAPPGAADQPAARSRLQNRLAEGFSFL